MLDINYIRENIKAVKQGMRAKGGDNTQLVDELYKTDQQWRALVQKTDDLRHQMNVKSREIGTLMKDGKKEEAQKLIAYTSKTKEQIKQLENDVEQLQLKRKQMLLEIPNIPHESVPVGNNEEDNEVLKTWGNPLKEKWRKPHWQIAKQKEWIDFERGAKVTGAGFPFYLGPLAKLQRSLINYFLNSAAGQGYTEMQVPYFINEDSARGTGQIPDKEDQMYVIPRDDFFAIPTAEVPVTNFHRDEIIEGDDLPLSYAAYTPCWRREAGSYGKEVRGLNRLHQFDKVELVKIVQAETSWDELERLRAYAESLLEDLELPYRTLLMCSGDMGFTQAKQYDLEVWSPGQQRWLEVSSCSNFTDYQTRRMQLRYRNEHGDTEMLHSLNGSALALPRVVAAILEAYQQKDGRIAVPGVLQSFMGCEMME